MKSIFLDVFHGTEALGELRAPPEINCHDCRVISATAHPALPHHPSQKGGLKSLRLATIRCLIQSFTATTVQSQESFVQLGRDLISRSVGQEKLRAT